MLFWFTFPGRKDGMVSARGGSPDGNEEWGYVPIRTGASMFYWFYKSTQFNATRPVPIVLWLQVKY